MGQAASGSDSGQDAESGPTQETADPGWIKESSGRSSRLEKSILGREQHVGPVHCLATRTGGCLVSVQEVWSARNPGLFLPQEQSRLQVALCAPHPKIRALVSECLSTPCCGNVSGSSLPRKGETR